MSDRGRSGAGLLLAVLVIAAVVLGIGAGHVVRDLAAEPRAAPSTSRPTTPAVVGAATGSPASSSAAAAPPARAGAVAALLAARLGVAALGTTGAYVVDQASGSVLTDRRSGTGFAPASTAKLLTAAATLLTTGPQARFGTVALAGSGPGQVVLVGGGDPTLSAARAGRPSIFRDAARLSDLAGQVRAALGGQQLTSVVVDGARFTGPTVAPGWQAEDIPSSYAAPITALVVDGGLPASGGPTRSTEPDLQAGVALARLLGAPGVPVTRGAAPPGARQLGAVRSPPMLELVEQMLKESDNVMAEMFGREVARREHQPASFAGAVAGVRAALTSAGLGAGAQLVDASGLSEDDRIAPRTLVALLQAVADGRHAPLGDLVNALPVAGWDGTLAERYAVGGSRVGAGRVRAKTGTIDEVVTLAGIVRDVSGRLLVFAFMARGVPDVDRGEQALDSAAAALANCGCR